MKVYEAGQRVRNANYGAGVVLTADAEYTTIRFRQYGIKKFVTSMMQMEAVEDQRPKSTASATPLAEGDERSRRAARSSLSRKTRPARSPRRTPPPRSIPASRPARRGGKRTHSSRGGTSRRGGASRRRTRAIRRGRSKRRR